MSRNVSFGEVQVALTSIARRNPTKVNTGQQYRTATGERCLVGAALDALALPTPPVFSTVNGSSVAELEAWLRRSSAAVTFDPDARVLLSRVQGLADRGSTWGDAVGAVVAA